jgi:pyruvate dehydrogenase E2 component (dihydrolipoamide acetyltransferase)
LTEDFHFELPDVGEGVHEGEIVNWLVGEGDEVEEDEDIVEVMTDKATVQISAPVAGTIADLRFQEGDVVEVGEVFVVIEPEEGAAEPEMADERSQEPTGEPEPEASGPEPQPASASTNGEQPQRTPEGILAPPSVRIEARKRGIDIAEVEGSGPAGRISMEDLGAHEPTGEPAEPEPATTSPTDGVGGVADVLPYDVEPDPVDRGQAREVEAVRAGTRSPRAHAARAMRLQPHFTHAVEIRADELVENVENAADEGVPETTLTTAFVVKAIARGLQDHEPSNAWVDEESRDLVVADRVNVAVATPTEDGLELRTVADADEKGVLAIARTLEDGGDEDVEATFTVTAYEGQGGLVATPVLIHPQVAGASIGRIRDVAKLEDGEAVPAKQLSLAFTFDHRYIDGYDGALLADDVEELLSSPGSMLLG